MSDTSMESPTTTHLNEAQTVLAAHAWWDGLTDAWKQAFNEVALRRSSTEPLDEEMLLRVFSSPNHRFAGPTAPYPNMSFELDDMSGLVGLPNTELVVVTFHNLTHIREAAQFKNLRSLFLYNNKITSLEGIEEQTELRELYVNVNQISALAPLAKLTNLRVLYCNYNQLESLDGIGEQHADCMEDFYCLPNPFKDSVAMRFEREVGIRCKKA
jgi:Leucine-rich repeat (LRR) protein